MLICDTTGMRPFQTSYHGNRFSAKIVKTVITLLSRQIIKVIDNKIFNSIKINLQMQI